MIIKREIQLAARILGSESKVARYLGFSRQFLLLVKKGERPMPKKRYDRLIELIGQ